MVISKIGNIVVQFINLNGKLIPASGTLPAHNNSAFRHGYGLFETMLFRDGHIQLKQYHWDRLFAGMKQLHCFFPPNIDTKSLEDEIYKTVQKNKLEQLCRVRLQVFCPSRGLFDIDTQAAQFIIECFPLEPSSITLNENGLVLGIAAGLQKSPDAIANLKTSNSLIYAMAAQQANENKWNDAVILNTSGHIIETTIANIFWIKDNSIFTPPLSSGCIAGVMRRYIITTLASKGITIQEKEFSKEMLLSAAEVFLTNAIKGIKWVSTFEHTKFSLPIHTKQLYQQLQYP